MLSEAYEAAITRVVVMPADDYGFRYSSYNYQLRNFETDIINSHNWSTEFSSYTGDERALSDEDKKLINKTRENPPREEEIISCLKEGIYNDFLYKVRNYYSHY